MKVRKRIRTDSRLRKAFLGLCAAVLIFSGVPAISLAEEDGTSTDPNATELVTSASDENGSDPNEALKGNSDDAVPLQPSPNGLPESAASGSTHDTNSISGAAEEAIDDVSDPSENTEAQNALAGAAIPLSSSSLRSPSGGVGALNVQLSKDDSTFVNVSDYTDGIINWEIGELKTMHVDFEFGSGTDKSIVITIPDDYTIVGYSAVEGSDYLNGLQQLEIHPQYKDFFLTSTVVGTDGSTKWTRQYLDDPYLSWESTSEAQIHTYGGIVSYTFADSTTKGQIVITLEPRYKLLSHTNSEELLNSVDTAMSSSAGSLKQSFKANVTGLSTINARYAHGVWGSEYKKVTYDSETGISQEFGIVSSADSYNWDGDYGHQAVYLQDWTYTITYPKGVSFANKIFCEYLGLGDYETSGGDVVPNHFNLSVTGNSATGGTVTFTFTNTTFGHKGGEDTLGAYFIADTSIAESLDLPFTMAYQMNNRGKSTSGTKKYTRSLIDGSGSYLISVNPINEKHRYIESDYPGYSYDYVLGGFDITSELAYSDITLSYDFSGLRGVRGLGVPGYNIHDIVATTTDGRTINLDSVDGKATAYSSVAIQPIDLGLNEDEYLTSLVCKANLEQLHYHKYYSYGFNYFGRFADGQEGDVVMSILDDSGSIAQDDEGNLLTATDHTTIRYQKSGSHWMGAYLRDLDNISRTTFFPNDTIKIEEEMTSGCMWTDSDTITDPIVMISLPKGVSLDTSSVEAVSESGNHGKDWFALQQIKTPYTHDVDGVEWTTYYFTSCNPLDMVACEQLPGYGGSTISVRFEAHASSNCPPYGQLDMADCLQWDLNVASEKITDWRAITDLDTHNRAGKGVDYRITELAKNFSIEPLIGLNVDLGIRVKDSDVGFFTFDTTDSSIAPITKTKNAEVRISYENTASTDYFQESSIFLPIPRVGHDYSKYFQNIELKDPLNKTTNKAFEFNTYLKTQIALSGFDTYYAIDATENTEAYDPSANARTWEPVTVTRWYSYDELISSSYSLSDVIMVKLVASENVATGVSANGTFELSIDNDARIGQLDYWRAYSKAITDSENNTGVWNHSSVLAATPASDGLIGQLFIDSNNDGYFGAVDGDSAYTAGNVTAILNRDDGTMANLALAVQPDGSFRSLNDNGTVYFLKSGDYTITFTNVDETYVFSRVPGSQSSDGSAWYNDLRSSGIKGSEAEYHFTVDENSELASYVGIALTDFVEVISVDVPVRVNIALNTDGTWCTPTALRNRIINRSTCAMHVASAVATTKSDFGLQSTSDFTTSGLDNALAGTIAPADSAGAATGTPQDLTSISTAGDKWTMPLGQTRAGVAVADGTNELPLQLAGSIRSVEGHYFTAPINVFDITYTFEKAGE